jgi:hypothetical protein
VLNLDIYSKGLIFFCPMDIFTLEDCFFSLRRMLKFVLIVCVHCNY